MPSGRLYEPLIGSELATQVGSFSLALPEPSLLMFYVQTRDGQDMDEIKNALLDTIEQAKVNPPTEEEVTRAVNALISDIEQNLNDSGRVGVELSEWAAMGDWRLMFLHRDRVESVTTEDVSRVLNQYLKRDNRTIGIFLPDSQPQRAEIPVAPELEVLLANYQGREVEAVAEVFEPSAENIEANRVSFTLSNGAKVTVLPKPTRGQRVWGQITLRTGNLESLSGLGSIPQMTTAMLTRGSENYSRQDIRDEVDKLRSSMGISGAERITVSLESQRDRLEPLMAIIEDVLKNPVFPQNELDELKRQRLTGIEQQRDEPSAVANQAISRHLNPYSDTHPDYTPSWEEQVERIEAVEVTDLRAFHQSHFGMGPQTTISFVGDIDVNQLKLILEEAFGEWDSAVPYEVIAPTYTQTDGEILNEQMPDKANAMMLGIQTIPMRSDHPDYPALKLAGEMLGGGFLNSRLADRIRDQEGLSYGVGGRIQASDLFESGTFFAYAMFAPQNRDRLISVVFEELNRVLDEGFSQEEMEAVRSGYLKELELQRSSDRALTGLLNQNLFLDRDLYYWSNFEEALQNLTVEEVNEATRRYLDPEALLMATAGDFEKKQPTPSISN